MLEDYIYTLLVMTGAGYSLIHDKYVNTASIVLSVCVLNLLLIPVQNTVSTPDLFIYILYTHMMLALAAASVLFKYGDGGKWTQITIQGLFFALFALDSLDYYDDSGIWSHNFIEDNYTVLWTSLVIAWAASLFIGPHYERIRSYLVNIWRGNSFDISHSSHTHRTVDQEKT